MKNENIYEKCLGIFILFLSIISGYFVQEQFGWIGIGCMILVGYILLMLIPDYLTKKLKRRNE